MDLLQRNISRRKDKLKMRAELALNEIFKGKPPSPEVLAENFEVGRLKMKVCCLEDRSSQLPSVWTVGLHAYGIAVRGVAICEGGPNSREDQFLLRSHVPSILRPTLWSSSTVSFRQPVRASYQSAYRYVHISYTLQLLCLLPYRCYKYKKLQWHYFLFDLCYYVNILNFVFLWILPHSPSLFVACYCLSHGSVASAIITWRNSLVFHDSDKVTSLFIHIYPPFTFTVIRCALRLFFVTLLIWVGQTLLHWR